jgi:putative transposase
MSRRTSVSAGKVYGVRRVCRAWEVAPSSYYAWQRRQHLEAEVRRRGPRGEHCDEDLVAAIRGLLRDSPFTGEGYRKIWARLRFAGIRTSKERVRRLMREHNLQAPVRVGKPRGPRHHDGSITTDAPDVLWGKDMTATLLASGQQANVFVAVDHCGIYCTGIHAAARGTRWEALEPIRQGVKESFGAFDQDVAIGLGVRHDHGSQYVSDDFQKELQYLGMESSPAFVRAPQGNGCAEWFIRILKENLLWVQAFETVEELRQALITFKRFYNHHWLMGKYGNKTPAEIRRERSCCPKTAA